jgi:hypothetical protein
MKVMNLHDDKFIMIDHLHRVIKIVLETKKEFYPMAVALDLNNKISLDVDIKTDDYPSSIEMISRYDKELNRKLKNNEIQSFCVAYDVMTTRNIESKKTDAITFKIKNSSTDETEILYYSYELNNNKKFELTDVWEETNSLIK